MVPILKTLDIRGIVHLVERKSQGFDDGGPARDLLIDPSSHRVRTSIARRLESRCDELLLELLVREGHPCRFVKPFDDRLRRSRGSDQCDVVLNDPTGNAGLNPSGDFWRADETPGTCDSQNAQLATAMEFDQLPVRGGNNDWNLPAQGIRDCRACATIGYVLMSVLVRVLNNSPLRWFMPPAPADPNESLPGLVFA